jgi:predicted  nucleic acid-binding Zn-ribbon protein
MSDDGRILRLENALTTLAELSADHERRVTRLEEAFVTLIELARSHSEGMDELRAAQVELSTAQVELSTAQVELSTAQVELSTAQAETEHKLAALVDAQIRTEEALSRLTTRVREIDQGGQPSQSDHSVS